MLGRETLWLAADEPSKGADVLLDLAHFVGAVWLDDDCPYGRGCHLLRGETVWLMVVPLVVWAGTACLPVRQALHTRIVLSSNTFQSHECQLCHDGEMAQLAQGGRLMT